MREGYLNLQKLNQIAQDHLRTKQDHLLSLQEQVKEKVKNMKQEEERRNERQMAIQSIIEMKRKAKVLKLKTSLCEKNIETRRTTQEQSKAEHKRSEDKLRNPDDTRTYELMNQRDYLEIELTEFQDKAKDYKMKMAKYDISRRNRNNSKTSNKKKTT
uniref:Uncharacterized protein n=1 Tax=Cacopsylla melanoneura TaxID=428564 RepID=A0A8D8ZEC5_9HEMI